MFQFLSDAGVLEHPDEDKIREMKRLYRKIYKSNWAKTRRLPHKEIRISFTPREYREILIQAKMESGLNPTAHSKQLILSSLTANAPIHDRAILLEILHHVSVCAIALTQDTALSAFKDGSIQTHLQKAEEMLLACVHKGEHSFVDDSKIAEQA